MLDNLQIKDVYIKIDDYPNISEHAQVGNAFHLMHHVLEDKNKFRTILVLDDDDHLKGYLSLRDLIRAVGPDYLHKSRPDIKGHQPFSGFSQDLTSLSMLWQDEFVLNIQDELAKPVSDYMTLMEDHVSMDDTITKCIYLMLLRDVLILPVVEEEQVLGVVRLVDVFDRIADSVDKLWMPKLK